jgi:hypothetical protein
MMKCGKEYMKSMERELKASRMRKSRALMSKLGSKE